MLSLPRSWLARLSARYASRFPLALTALGFSLLWAFAFWPGLHDAWYFYDDFLFSSTSFSFNLKAGSCQGRPLFALWAATYVLDRDPANPLANILLRWLQGVIHVSIALMAAYLLWQQLRSWYASLAVLPFLLWSFNAETV